MADPVSAHDSGGVLSVLIESLRFRYPTDRFELSIHELSLPGDGATGIIGPSGCGKSTLLKLMTGILRPDSGRVEVLGQPIERLSDADARRFRVANIGMVFQEFELLDYLTGTENVTLPFRISDALTLDSAVEDRVLKLAETTGIRHLLDAYPHTMSQGERQRVAICRALITRPKLIVADEPTGSLDPENQQRIVSLLRTTAKTAGAPLVMVTHDHELLNQFDHVVDVAQLEAIPT